ncbi:MAG: hypothetical protein DYH05_07290 [Acidobacteria bacterium ACB1]|nr:hypothetical protein [Acidobacteria bacterium ACB1]
MRTLRFLPNRATSSLSGIFHVDSNAKNAKVITKITKTLPRKVQNKLSNINQPQEEYPTVSTI